jgi:hypothetical protein
MRLLDDTIAFFHDLADWADERRYWIAGAIIVTMAVAILTSVPCAPKLEVWSVGPITCAKWEPVDGARAYQIQGKLNGEGDWQTVAVTWGGTNISWPSIPGMMEYRIRAWSDDGPGRWSCAHLVFFLPQPMVPEKPSEGKEASCSSS